jgi:hypothetical protein
LVFKSLMILTLATANALAAHFCNGAICGLLRRRLNLCSTLLYFNSIVEIAILLLSDFCFTQCSIRSCNLFCFREQSLLWVGFACRRGSLACGLRVPAGPRGRGRMSSVYLAVFGLRGHVCVHWLFESDEDRTATI